MTWVQSLAGELNFHQSCGQEKGARRQMADVFLHSEGWSRAPATVNAHKHCSHLPACLVLGAKSLAQLPGERHQSPAKITHGAQVGNEETVIPPFVFCLLHTKLFFSPHLHVGLTCRWLRLQHQRKMTGLSHLLLTPAVTEARLIL